MLVPVTVIGMLAAAICRPPRRSGAARTGRLATGVARAGQAAAIPPARGSADKPGAKAAAPSASAMSTAHVVDVLILALAGAGRCGGWSLSKVLFVAVAERICRFGISDASDEAALRYGRNCGLFRPLRSQ